MYRCRTVEYWHGGYEYTIQKKNWLGIWVTYKRYDRYKQMMKEVDRLVKAGKEVL